MKIWVIAAFGVFVLLAMPGSGSCYEEFDRGLFVSAIQDPPVLASREAIEGLVEFAREARIGTIFIQAHYRNRSWFRSETADGTPYEECLEYVGEDPLKVLITEAHSAGIEVHAWLNMLSLGSNCEAPILSRHGTDVLTKNKLPKRSLEDYKIDGQYFLEPGDERVREAVSAIVSEVVLAYPDLDGIQLDYIRYPDQHPAYGHTEANVKRFTEATGLGDTGECSETWKKWKRDQVTEALEIAVRAARSIRPAIKVSATGCMPYSRAYHEAFQDWPSWIDRGIVDFVTVMSYSPYPEEMERWITRAREKTSDFRKVMIGVGAYKLLRSGGIFRRELRISEDSGAGGFVVFHYGSFLEDPDLARVLAGE